MSWATKRSLFAGVVDDFNFSGNMEMGMAIRTMLVTGDRVYLQAGAGIVADRDPQKECTETKHKAGVLVEAFRVALEITTENLNNFSRQF